MISTVKLLTDVHRGLDGPAAAGVRRQSESRHAGHGRCRICARVARKVVVVVVPAPQHQLRAALLVRVRLPPDQRHPRRRQQLPRPNLTRPRRCRTRRSSGQRPLEQIVGDESGETSRKLFGFQRAAKVHHRVRPGPSRHGRPRRSAHTGSCRWPDPVRRRRTPRAAGRRRRRLDGTQRRPERWRAGTPSCRAGRTARCCHPSCRRQKGCRQTSPRRTACRCIQTWSRCIDPRISLELPRKVGPAKALVSCEDAGVVDAAPKIAA